MRPTRQVPLVRIAALTHLALLLVAMVGAMCSLPRVVRAETPGQVTTSHDSVDAHARAQKAEFVLIGNRTGASDVDAAALHAIFRGERSIWASKQTVIIVLPSSRADYAEDFARVALDMTRMAMQKYWLALVFQGRANPPVFLDTADDVIAFVKRTPGTVAMVPARSDVPKELVIQVR